MNHYRGIVRFLNSKNSLYEGFITTNSYKHSLKNSKFEKLKSPLLFKNYILTLNRFKYFVTIQEKYSKTYLQSTRNSKFGRLITNSFFTLTGGILFYKFRKPKGISFYTKKDCHELEVAYLNDLNQKIRKQLNKENLEEHEEVKYFQQLKKVESLQDEFSKYLTKYEKNQEWLQIKDNPTSCHRTAVER